MTMIPAAVICFLSGAGIVGGSYLAITATIPRHVRLDDALNWLAQNDNPQPATKENPPPPPTRPQRLALAIYQRLRLPLSDHTHKLLHRGDLNPIDHITHKTMLALAGAALPTLLGGLSTTLFGTSPIFPIALAALLCIAGFLWPDHTLRIKADNALDDANEALLTFLDLVILERLANQSAPQSLAAAASISDITPFRQIYITVEQARLEQHTPYNDLRRLADQLELPALRDIIDIISLDEHGASLATTLRARAKELRNAHLTRQRIKAHEQTEHMTIYMVIPALILGLIYLTPPILALLQ